MNVAHRELKILKEEEKVLNNIAQKLREQLNRLKVEELALLSDLKNDEETESVVSLINSVQEQVEGGAVHIDAALDLNVTPNFLSAVGLDAEEEEEEEEEDDEEEEPKSAQDQLSAFLEQLSSANYE